MMALRIGVVGAGTMGALHARVIAAGDGTKLAWVADPDEQVGRRVAERFGVPWLPAPELDGLDAVVVAAPTQHHFAIAREVIARRLPLLLEKPLADTLEHSEQLVRLARESGSVLMCGLLERFNPAVRTASEITRDPLRVATLRHSPYSPRIRTGVASDLLIHDADLAVRLFGAEPVSVASQFGWFHPTSESGSEDLAEAVARFPKGQIAVLSASRLSQHKVRTLSIAELDRSIEVDLLRQSITIYRNAEGASYDEEAGYTQQTIIEIPVVRHAGEPLQLQLQRFVGLIDGEADPAEELAGLLPAHRVVDSASRAAAPGEPG